MIPKRMMTVQPLGSVLVVDDNVDIHRLLGRWLTGAGYKVFFAADVEEAKRTLAAQPIELAVFDVHLPSNGEGIELADWTERQSSQTQLIFATVVQDLDPRVTLRPHVSGYLTKPLTSTALLAALRRATHELQARRSQSTLRRQLPAGVAEDVVEGEVVAWVDEPR